MRISLFLLLLLFTTISNTFAQEADGVIRLSEPVRVTDTHEQFGDALDPAEFENAVSLTDLIESESRDGAVTLKAEVSKVCQKKGCFFMASDENYTARVTFKDYAFFIPTDSQGKQVLFHGDFSVKTLSEDQAKHYAEDAGDNPESVVGDQEEYSIVASSILVPKP